MSLLEDLNEKLSHVQEQAKIHSDSCKEIDEKIASLQVEKCTSHTFFHTFSGAIQAYQDMINAIGKAAPLKIVEDAIQAVGAVVDAE